jgi:hypothetical protein
MKPQHIGAVGTVLAFAALTCKGDPTASLRAGAALLSVTPSQFFIDTGATGALVIIGRDAQLNPVPLGVTVTSSDATIAKVVPDTTRPSVDGSIHAFVISALAPGRAKLSVAGGSLTDSSIVSVLPLAFNGVISKLTPKGGDTVAIRSTTRLKFNPAKDTVTFGGGHSPAVLINTADSVVVLAPFSDPAPLTITGVVVTYVTGLEVTLPSSGTVQQTGDRWAGDGSWQTAPDITALLPAAGKSVKLLSGTGPSNKAVCPEFALGFGSKGPCMMFKFTLAATTTLNFTTDWEGTAAAPDIDIYACADSTVANFGAACFEDGGGGATASKPQATGNYAYAAGTHYFVIETYDGAASKNLYTTISRP